MFVKNFHTLDPVQLTPSFPELWTAMLSVTACIYPQYCGPLKFMFPKFWNFAFKQRGFLVLKMLGLRQVLAHAFVYMDYIG